MPSGGAAEDTHSNEWADRSIRSGAMGSRSLSDSLSTRGSTAAHGERAARHRREEGAQLRLVEDAELGRRAVGLRRVEVRAAGVVHAAEEGRGLLLRQRHAVVVLAAHGHAAEPEARRLAQGAAEQHHVVVVATCTAAEEHGLALCSTYGGGERRAPTLARVDL
jgi:hypothetical protein